MLTRKAIKYAIDIKIKTLEDKHKSRLTGDWVVSFKTNGMVYLNNGLRTIDDLKEIIKDMEELQEYLNAEIK